MAAIHSIADFNESLVGVGRGFREDTTVVVIFAYQDSAPLQE